MNNTMQHIPKNIQDVIFEDVVSWHSDDFR